MIKKILSLMLCIVLLLANIYSVSAASDLDSAVFRLEALGILLGDENGDLQLDKELTRAEFTAILVRMLGIDTVTFADGTQGNFSDVMPEHWAYGAITTAAGLNIIEGKGDGTFCPDEYVTNEQVMKMLVCALGYEIAAENQGGYPEGYMAVAVGRGITKGASVIMNNPCTRANAAICVNNALDVKLLESFSTTGELTTTEDTLYDRLIKNMDGVWKKGKLTETEFTGIDGTSTLEKDRVNIGGVIYDCTGSDIEEYLGYMLEVYAAETDSSALPKILSFRIMKNKTKEVVVNAEDVSNFAPDRMDYYNEKKKINTLDIDASSVKYIYNGKAVDPNTFVFSDMKINNGRYRFLDSEGTGNYDIIFVEEEESFVVSRVAEANTTVYFDNQELFRLRSGIKFLFDDEDYTYIITDENGEEMEFSDISEGMAITLTASTDMKIVKAVLCENRTDGMVSELNEDDDEVKIDENVYKIARNADGNLLAQVKLGDEAVFVLDARGRIIGVDEIISKEHYAYVINADTKRSIGSDLQLKLISVGDKEKSVRVAGDGQESISYRFYNSDIFIVDCVAKDIDKNDVIGKVIKYTLNSEGEIKKLTTYEVPSSKREYTFNSRILSFGANLDIEGFLVDDTTNLICIPNVVRTEDDYLEVVDFANGKRVEAIPYEVDAETQIAEAVLIFEDMNSTTPPPIASDKDVSIVGKIRHINDDEYGDVVEIAGITREDIFSELTGNNAAANSAANRLRAGDLIRYTLDRNGRLAKIEQEVSVQGLSQSYAQIDSAYGVAYDVSFNRLSKTKNEMVDRLVITENEDGGGWSKEYEILKEDGPVIYVYEKSGPRIYAATTDDIDTILQVGSGASKIYMSIENSIDPVAIVIIKE